MPGVGGPIRTGVRSSPRTLVPRTARVGAEEHRDQQPHRTDRDPCRDRRDRGDDGRAVADPADRPAPRHQHRARHARAARQHVDPARPRLLDLPVVPPHRDAVPARAQRVGHPARAAARLRRQGHRVVRSLRGRRLGHRRPRDLPHPHRDPVHRDHERCRARRRGRGPIHARRDARQADGDRRRPQLRPDQRDRGEAPPQGDRRRSRLLRRDGRCVEVREGRRDRGHRDRAHQPDRRVRDRHPAEAHVVRRRGLEVQPAHRRRRAWSRRSPRCSSRCRRA